MKITYRHNQSCSNCKAEIWLTVSKGTRVEDEHADKECKFCECLIFKPKPERD